MLTNYILSFPPLLKPFFYLLECFHNFFSHLLTTSINCKPTVQDEACQIESLNATLQNVPALTLGSIATSLAKGLKSKFCRFSAILMLIMFQTLLLVNQDLYKYLKQETVDLVQAVEYKMVVQSTQKLLE